MLPKSRLNIFCQSYIVSIVRTAQDIDIMHMPIVTCCSFACNLFFRLQSESLAKDCFLFLHLLKCFTSVGSLRAPRGTQHESTNILECHEYKTSIRVIRM